MEMGKSFRAKAVSQPVSKHTLLGIRGCGLRHKKCGTPDDGRSRLLKESGLCSETGRWHLSFEALEMVMCGDVTWAKGTVSEQGSSPRLATLPFCSSLS